MIVCIKNETDIIRFNRAAHVKLATNLIGSVIADWRVNRPAELYAAQ
jgi:hypothetical protein